MKRFISIVLCFSFLPISAWSDEYQPNTPKTHEECMELVDSWIEIHDRSKKIPRYDECFKARHRRVMADYLIEFQKELQKRPKHPMKDVFNKYHLMFVDHFLDASKRLVDILADESIPIPNAKFDVYMINLLLYTRWSHKLLMCSEELKEEMRDLLETLFPKLNRVLDNAYDDIEKDRKLLFQKQKSQE
jgi:hypothetical protein